MEKIDLTKQVQDSISNVYNVVSINLQRVDNVDEIVVNYDNFINKYVNYVDPKDAEIARLKLIIDELQNPIKSPHRKKRLLHGEWKEIEELIRKGVGNTEIANEYGISDSGVSKRRTTMRSLGEKV